MSIKKAKELAKYTEALAATEHWGVDDQDCLEWLISEVERLQTINKTYEETLGKMLGEWQKEIATRCAEIAEPRDKHVAKMIRKEYGL